MFFEGVERLSLFYGNEETVLGAIRLAMKSLTNGKANEKRIDSAGRS
jgi:hypothetical protein